MRKSIHKSNIVRLAGVSGTISLLELFDYLPALIDFFNQLIDNITLFEGVGLPTEKVMPFLMFVVSVLILLERVYRTRVPIKAKQPTE